MATVNVEVFHAHAPDAERESLRVVKHDVLTCECGHVMLLEGMEWRCLNQGCRMYGLKWRAETVELRRVW